jgi:putative DNA primase/helicase
VTNAEHEAIDPFEEKVKEKFDWKEGWEKHALLKMTTTQVLEKIGYDKPSRSDAIRMGKILIKLTGKKPKKSNGDLLHSLPFLNSNLVNG